MLLNKNDVKSKTIKCHLNFQTKTELPPDYDSGRRKTEFRSQFRGLRRNKGSEGINKWVDINES